MHCPCELKDFKKKQRNFLLLKPPNDFFSGSFTRIILIKISPICAKVWKLPFAISKIYGQEMSKLYNQGLDLVSDIPMFASVRSSL